MNTRTYAPEQAQWQRAVDGDRDSFEAAVAPLQDLLLRAARQQVALERRSGRLSEDALTPEELYGETLLRAWTHRAGFGNAKLGFRAWLLGLQHRTLGRLAAAEADYDDRKAISLDEEVPTREEYDAVEEQLYEFREPFEVTTYEDIIPGSTPDDVEIDVEGRPDRALSEAERELLLDADLDMDVNARRVALFHGEFELSLEETSQILDLSLRDTAENYDLARNTLHERIGTRDIPENPSDAIDSYTGDPVS